MALWGKRDQYSDAPKFTTDAATGETGQEEFGTQVFGVDAAEVAAGDAPGVGWVRRVAGSGGRSGRVQHEVLCAMSGADAFSTGDATDFANTDTVDVANTTGTADDSVYPDS